MTLLIVGLVPVIVSLQLLAYGTLNTVVFNNNNNNNNNVLLRDITSHVLVIIVHF